MLVQSQGVSAPAQSDLYEIAQETQPKVNLGVPFEPDSNTKIHNLLEHAAKEVGLNPSQAKQVSAAYDESVSPERQGLQAKHLAEISPQVFLLIGQKLKQESEKPHISRSEMNQWAGFSTRSSPEVLQQAESGLAAQMQDAAVLAKSASDAQFLNKVSGAIGLGAQPELLGAVPSVLNAANNPLPLTDQFGSATPI